MRSFLNLYKYGHAYELEPDSAIDILPEFLILSYN